ncbi:MAG: UbiA family prenyltransferase [Planctomycetaceae bacterium]
MTTGISSPTGILPWLKLMRLPTVFTALSNILCGYFISSPLRELPALIAQPALWLLMLASAGLYLGGMVLNDVFDAALDAHERPERPIPSGRISVTGATALGIVLMIIGVSSAAVVSQISDTGQTSLVLAVILAAVVVFYDSLLKNTPAAPAGMASCRGLNMLLGASSHLSIVTLFSADCPVLWVATGLAVYVSGVTWFARNEAGHSSMAALSGGLLVVLAGLSINVVLAERLRHQQSAAAGALIALSLIAANVSLRCVRAIRSNQPVLLQKTVGFMLLNIIFVDAAMTFCLTGSGRLATVVVILVIPATLMKRILPLS